MNTRDWPSVLDEYEAVLDARADAITRAASGELADELGDTPAFDPPTGMPPVPDELRERAGALLARTRLLAELAAEGAEGAEAARSRRGSPSTTTRRRSGAFDARA